MSNTWMKSIVEKIHANIQYTNICTFGPVVYFSLYPVIFCLVLCCSYLLLISDSHIYPKVQSQSHPPLFLAAVFLNLILSVLLFVCAALTHILNLPFTTQSVQVHQHHQLISLGRVISQVMSGHHGWGGEILSLKAKDFLTGMLRHIIRNSKHFESFSCLFRLKNF